MMSYRQLSYLVTKVLLLLVLLMCTNLSWAQFLSAPAFPGAEGFGRYTTGGRGGQVIHVTNLNDSGTGSLRAAISTSGKRIIVFDVAGTIALQSDLKITNDDCTILGQTAPGDGICLRNYPLTINANNVIVRYIRCRLGDTAGKENDAMSASHDTGTEKHNIIIDHCSISWSVDECASFYGNEDFTLQWCIISEALRNSIHSKGAHSYGAIWGGRKAAFHHNLIAHNDSRNPRFDHGYVSELAGVVDYINNVVYNWGGNSTYGGENKVGLEPKKFNMINNFYKPGPYTSTKTTSNRLLNPTTKCSNCNSSDQYGVVPGKFYINGNKVNGSTVSLTTSSTSSSNISFDSGYSFSAFASNCLSDSRYKSNDNDFGSYNTVSLHSADDAFSKTVQYAGASLSRDAVDTRIATETTNGTFTYDGSNGSTKGLIDTQGDVSGWPTYSGTAQTDTDNDGIPDAWETAHGLSNSTNNAATYTLDPYGFYTDLEVYANYLVQDITKNERAGAAYSFDEYYPLDANAISPVSDTQASAPYITASNTGKVTISSIESNATIYYTTDGTAPTTSGKQYSTPFTVSTACTVKAIAVVSGKANSNVTSYEVTHTGIANAYMVDAPDPGANATISSVEGITMTYGACTDWVTGDANITVSGTTFPYYAAASSSNGTNSTSLATSKPTDKSYWIFTPTEDGTLTLAVHNIGTGKAVCIVEDGTMTGATLIDKDGTTTSSLTSTTLTPGGNIPSSSSWSGGIRFDVKAGSTYTYSLAGSKGHLCGFIFNSASNSEESGTLFSLEVTSGETLNMASGSTQNISGYATIVGGSASVYNGKSGSANMVESSKIKLGGSSSSYLKLELTSALQAGDIINITDAGNWKLANANSNSSAITVTVPYTITGTESATLAGKETLYIFKTGTTGDPSSISAITITRPSGTTPTMALIDGEDYTATEDATYEEVTFTKEFSTSLANKWTALYVPFVFEIADYAEAFDIAEITSFQPYADTNGDGQVTDEDGDMLIITRLKSGTTLPNTPYLIKAKAAGTVTITPKDNKLYAATAGQVTFNTNKATYTFTGLNHSVTATAANDYYYMSSGSISHRTTGSTTIKPNRWYMTVSGSNAAKATFFIAVIENNDNGATGISSANAYDINSTQRIHTTGGIRVGNTKNMPSGIYLFKDKKIMKR